MKFTKRIISVLLSIMMIAALTVTAFADDTKTTTYTITINNTASGHTYEAYQIFAGDLSGDDTNGYVLSNITWGSGVAGDALLTALKVDATIGSKFTNAKTAADVAKAMGGITSDSADAKAFAQVVGQHLATVAGTSTVGTTSYTISGLSAGYYLVKDHDGTQKAADSYTSFILQVVKDAEVAPKGTVPTVEKKVLENAKYEQDGGYGTGYNDVADYNIGDAVPFELIGTLPANYADYTSYKYEFTDTASAGLTIDKDSVKVYVDGIEITSGFTTALDGQKLTVTFDNLKIVSSVSASSKIVVKYNATLNSSAVIGLDGNPNEVYLTFSNNPNQGGSGDTGKTPTDKVIVFTYELDTTKVDGATKDANGDYTTKLKDAEFELYKTDGTTTSYAQVTDGKVTGWTKTEADATKLVSGTDGLFKVAGLDDGTYYLKETKAPVGYNLLTDPVTLVITATTSNGQNWTSGTAADALTALTIKVGTKDAVDGNKDTGVVSATIANSKGATLPSTGGMGTIIFTIAGLILVICAGVFFTAKNKKDTKNV